MKAIISSWCRWITELTSGRRRRISRFIWWPTVVARSPCRMRPQGMSVITRSSGLDLLQADALRLGIADAVLIIGMGHADHHAADAAVHQPARRQAMGVGDVALGDPRIEDDAGIGRQFVDLKGPVTAVHGVLLFRGSLDKLLDGGKLDERHLFDQDVHMA